MSKLAILGCGTMGEAILGGLLRSGLLSPDDVRVTARRSTRCEALSSRHGVHAATDNASAAASADVVVLGLKPRGVIALFDDPQLATALRGRVVVSIAAGVSLARLEAAWPESAVVRAMPNTPGLVGQGMTVLARGKGVTDEQLGSVREVFNGVGRVVELDDRHMDAVTSLNGSGPAFVYVMLEAMADGGVMMGLPRGVALEIAAQVFHGASAMVLDTGTHPAALKDEVTTPAGSTIAGLLTMEDGRVRSVLARTIQEATEVAGRLGGTGDQGRS